jgi:hypothetical protein
VSIGDRRSECEGSPVLDVEGEAGEGRSLIIVGSVLVVVNSKLGPI